MLKKNLSKILIIAFIACIGAIAMPTEAKAVNKIEGTFSPWNNVNDQMEGTLYGYRIWGTLHYGRFCPDGGFPDGQVCKQGFWNKHGVFVPIDDFELAPYFRFDLLPGEHLMARVSFDVPPDSSSNTPQVIKCDVYNMESGSLLVEDFGIQVNDTFQAIPVTPSNSPNLIVFRVDEKVVAAQLFLFVCPNTLFIGGQDE